ncbi:hypothetical protein PR048_022154 [Dryococelus australis]|uniref:Gamma-tubulin complex component n=1 Tax=Dryococelus australis TaxID=614101 RepID=A0ABQ9H086_9NEOP|nr:hypothetical protein PR048_022154 [Dryococelus australis]
MFIRPEDVCHVSCVIRAGACVCSLLEKWIFEGTCSDIYGEFFIQAVPEFQCSSSRSYWNRGFSLDDSEVPAFLLGLQDSILQCAKTIALLKRCNPKDPLCVVGERCHHRVQCCLTKESLVELEAECKQYEATCRQLCGEPVSVSQLLQRSELDLHAIREIQRNRLLAAQREYRLKLLSL